MKTKLKDYQFIDFTYDAYSELERQHNLKCLNAKNFQYLVGKRVKGCHGRTLEVESVVNQIEGPEWSLLKLLMERQVQQAIDMKNFTDYHEWEEVSFDWDQVLVILEFTKDCDDYEPSGDNFAGSVNLGNFLYNMEYDGTL